MLHERTNDLYLPDLSITGFRGIERISIERLGRVTLLTGRNGIGKTTVLDAVRVYAARGRSVVLHDLLERREEFSTALDEDHDPIVFPDYAALFHGRNPERARSITIGPKDGADDFRIEVATPEDWSSAQKDLFADLPSVDLSTEADVQAVKIIYRKKEKLLPWFLAVNERRVSFSGRRHVRRLQRSLFDEGEWPVIECESLGPGLLSNNRLARFWDNVALTEEEGLSIETLRLILGDGMDRVAVVGDDERRYRGDGRRVVVKLRNHPRPVPLKSLGDGVTRMFAVGLALANSRGGFLVMDEAENGIHYSVQQNFWSIVLRAAYRNNVQVLATTHSWDCVKGFARAAVDLEETEGVLVRLERDGDHVRAVDYTKEDLEAVADQQIEVR